MDGCELDPLQEQELSSTTEPSLQPVLDSCWNSRRYWGKKSEVKPPCTYTLVHSAYSRIIYNRPKLLQPKCPLMGQYK